MDKFEQLVQIAKDAGATHVKITDVNRDVVVDERVRLKCEIPICYGYNRFLTCPPNVMSVPEFRKVLKLYSKGLIVQVVAEGINSLDKSEERISKELFQELEVKTHSYWIKKLHELVNTVEAEALKLGYYLSVGLIGGYCQLCSKCVLEEGGKLCRNPYRARPSMEALGIDIIKTCQNVGLSVKLSSEEEVKWTGLILVC